MDKELDWLLEQGYIHPSDSPWASPMVTVRKPDGTARLCVDFKRINEVTAPLLFCMPRVEEVLEAVGRSKVISKLDLSKGYYQVWRKLMWETLPLCATGGSSNSSKCPLA